MDEQLLPYAQDALNKVEKAKVDAYLTEHPRELAQAETLRQVFQLLQLDRDTIEPPSDLVLKTIILTAQHGVENGLFRCDPSAATRDDMPVLKANTIPVPVALPTTATAEMQPLAPSSGSFRPVRRWVFRPRWVDACVAACIAVLGVGLVLTVVQKLHMDRNRAACMDNLRQLHNGLTEFASTHDGRYPQIGPGTMAGSFVQILNARGNLPESFSLVCPATPVTAPAIKHEPFVVLSPDQVAQVGYVYTLGYRADDDMLVGFRQNDSRFSIETTPITADIPSATAAPGGGPFSPHVTGQHVLYASGQVQYVTRPTVGPDGDDIYRNRQGRVRAGVSSLDASLGRAVDLP